MGAVLKAEQPPPGGAFEWTPAARAALSLFITDVLNDEGACALVYAKQTPAIHLWLDSAASLADAFIARADDPDLYFTASTYSTKGTDFKGRTQANVAWLKAHRIDVDVGPNKGHKTREEALRALMEALKAGLPPPTYIVFSGGGGFHLYWCLTEASTRADWKPTAKALHAVAVTLALNPDSVTSDEARVLRLPGSLNSKTGVRAVIYKHTGRMYAPDEFAATIADLEPAGQEAITKAPPATRALRPMNAEVLAASFADRPPGSFSRIVEQCAAVNQAARDNGASTPEPLWRAMLGLVKFCADPDKNAHAYSKGHPGYEAIATQAKLDGWTHGPTTCEHFALHAPDACADCEHRGKIKSPIVLGTQTQAAARELGGVGEPFSDAGNDPVAGSGATVNAAAQVVATVRAMGIDPIRGTDGRYWAKITSGGACQAVQLESNEARDHVRLAIRRATGKCSEATLESAMSELRAQALESNTRQTVNLRVAKAGGSYFVSLGDGVTTMKIGPGLVEAIPAGQGPLFALGTGAGRLPTPIVPPTAQEAYALHDNFHKSRGVPDTSRLALIVATLECLRPDTPYPIIGAVGTAGSGKSTKAWEIKQFIDPTDSQALADVRFAEQDIAAAAQHQHLLVVDNASHLSAEKQDFACKVSTGVTVMCRSMYTTGGMDALNVHRPMLITSIGVVTTRPDLADRTVLIELPAREAFQSLEELQADYNAQQPALFGALLRMLASALDCMPAVRQRMPRSTVRLADFAMLGESLCEAAGIGGSFTAQLTALRKTSAVVAADSDAFVSALQRVIFTLWAPGAQAADAHPAERNWQRVGKGFSIIKPPAGGLSIRCTYGALM